MDGSSLFFESELCSQQVTNCSDEISVGQKLELHNGLTFLHLSLRLNLSASSRWTPGHRRKPHLPVRSFSATSWSASICHTWNLELDLAFQSRLLSVFPHTSVARHHWDGRMHLQTWNRGWARVRHIKGLTDRAGRSVKSRMRDKHAADGYLAFHLFQQTQNVFSVRVFPHLNAVGELGVIFGDFWDVFWKDTVKECFMLQWQPLAFHE